jgi:flagellar biosynthesis protein FlhB
MSDDRTKPATKRRLQLAREQGHVAHSPELTAAGGWLVALLLMGFWGETLAAGLVGLAQRSAGGTAVIWIDVPAFVSHIRQAVMELAVPLCVILTGFSAGAVVTHQLQVRGLWAFGLITPDPTRLWVLGRGGGMAAGIEKFAWSAIKAVVLAGVAFWAVRLQWIEMQRLGEQEIPTLVFAASHVVLRSARVLALAMVVLGVADFGFRNVRHEAMLRTTPEEQREDVRVMEGDVSLRAKRQRLARARQSDAPEQVAGASRRANSPPPGRL